MTIFSSIGFKIWIVLFLIMLVSGYMITTIKDPHKRARYDRIYDPLMMFFLVFGAGYFFFQLM